MDAKHYRIVTAQQLAEDERFQQWVKNGSIPEDLDQEWRAWLAAHPERMEVAEQARNILLAVYQDQQFIPDQQIKRNVWGRIDGTLLEDSRKANEAAGKRLMADTENATQVTKVRSMRWLGWAAAALVGVTASVAWYFTGDRLNATNSQSTAPLASPAVGITTVEADDHSLTLILEEGSSVVLQPHSKLSYPEHFASRDRKVSLKGEGFFEVAKDRKRPFFVETSHITTRVLGTSFSVRLFDDEQSATVRVKTGNVSVFRHHAPVVDSAEVMLSPRQQVVYSVVNEKLTKTTAGAKTPDLPPVASYNFEFRDTPLHEVFDMITTAYNVDIIYDEKTFSRCMLNASLDDVPFEEKLRLICKAIGATYLVDGSRVTISGEGCFN